MPTAVMAGHVRTFYTMEWGNTMAPRACKNVTITSKTGALLTPLQAEYEGKAGKRPQGFVFDPRETFVEALEREDLAGLYKKHWAEAYISDFLDAYGKGVPVENRRAFAERFCNSYRRLFKVSAKELASPKFCFRPALWFVAGLNYGNSDRRICRKYVAWAKSDYAKSGVGTRVNLVPIRADAVVHSVCDMNGISTTSTCFSRPS